VQEGRREWGRPLQRRRDPSKRSRATAPALPSTLSVGVVQSLSHRRSCRRQEESCPSPPSSDTFVVVTSVIPVRQPRRSGTFFLAGGGAHAGCEAGRRRWSAAVTNPRARYPATAPNPKGRSSGLSLIRGPAAAPWWRAMIEASASAPAPASASAPAAVESARARQKGPTGKHSELERAPARSVVAVAVVVVLSAVSGTTKSGRAGCQAAVQCGRWCRAGGRKKMKKEGPSLDPLPTPGQGQDGAFRGPEGTPAGTFLRPPSRGVFLTRRRRNRGGRERMK
jgi:hypothetical protein